MERYSRLKKCYDTQSSRMLRYFMRKKYVAILHAKETVSIIYDPEI